MTWYEDAGGCETPKDLARMNRSISFYLWRKIPTGELEQTIGWLDDIRADCEFKMREMEAIKNDRERAYKWRQDMNRLAAQFYDPDNVHLDLETRQKIVQQRLDVEPHIARHIADMIQAWAKRKIRKDRNIRICQEHRNGASVTALSKKHKISRQHVYNIVKNDDNMRFF